MDFEFIWIICLYVTWIRFVSSIPSYSITKACNEVIYLSGKNLAVEYEVPFDFTGTNWYCQFMVQTDYEHQIAYRFRNPGSFDPDKECEFEIKFGDQNTTEKVCLDNADELQGRLIEGSVLEVFMSGDLSKILTFTIQFVAVKSADRVNCNYNEYKCNSVIGAPDIPPLCLDYSLLCQHGLQLCTTTDDDYCSDIKSNDPSSIQSNTYIPILVSVLCILIVLASIIEFNRRRRNICFRTLRPSGNRNSSSRDIRSRAMAIFSTQLATRGVDSADGSDNRAYVDENGHPIDLSKFDPPPEYSSLEHLDRIGVTEPDISRDNNDDVTCPDISRDNNDDVTCPVISRDNNDDVTCPVISRDNNDDEEEPDDPPPCYQHVVANSSTFHMTTEL